MIRSFNALEKQPFDILIIGGGIYGAWTAYEAALRGLKTAVVDKGDWASGTSSVSSKLIHGGLRYLEHYDFGLVRTSLAERRLLAGIAPHKVLPQTFAVPLYNDFRVGPLRMKAGLMLYDFLAGRGQPVKSHRFLSGRNFVSRFPFLKKENIRAGFTYGDCYTDDARLVLEVIQGAVNMGAVAVNYARAAKLLIQEGCVLGAQLEDLETGETLDVKARITVNTAGPWNEELLNPGAEKKYTRWTKGVHLIMPPLPCDNAFLIMTEKDNRIFFLIPWYGKTILGTTDTDYAGLPDSVQVEKDDIDYLLREANRIFDGFQWTQKDIQGKFAGLRSLRNTEGLPPSSVSREWSLECPMKGLMMPVGGKLTSSRADAHRIMIRACRELKVPAGTASPTADRPLPWSPGKDWPGWRERMLEKCRKAGLDPVISGWCLFRYGILTQKIIDLVRSDSALAEPLFKTLPFCRAELLHCAAKEMVIHLEDLVRRRIPLLLLHPLSRSCLTSIAEAAGPVLGWSEEKICAEVDAVCGKWEIGG